MNARGLMLANKSLEGKPSLPHHLHGTQLWCSEALNGCVVGPCLVPWLAVSGHSGVRRGSVKEAVQVAANFKWANLWFGGATWVSMGKHEQNSFPMM